MKIIVGKPCTTIYIFVDFGYSIFLISSIKNAEYKYSSEIEN